MAATAALIIAPQVLYAGAVLADPALRHTLAAQPGATLAASVALIVWAALICYPIHRWVTRASRSRTIAVRADSVCVIDRTPVRLVAWSAPLSEFIGIAHHIRTSTSSVRHELVLVHPDRHKSLLLQANATLSEADAALWCQTLHQRQVPPRTLYGWAGGPFQDAARQTKAKLSPEIAAAMS